MAEWPGGARGALCLSFDNLGEAAELELGGHPDSPGEHFTATRVLPALLGALAERDLAATFFVEGLNAELYPDVLKAIAAGGHEVAYHAWRHEQWGDLSAEAQAENLARGQAAFAELGLEVAGMRPPGGQLGPGGVEVLSEAGLRYCSPAGDGIGVDGGVVLLPFEWLHVDASCVLPNFGRMRERIAGSPEPLGPDPYLSHVEREVGRLARDAGFATFVFHPFMLDWLGEKRLASLLDLLGATSAHDDLWLAPCAEVAEHVLGNPDAFSNGATLDAMSWTQETRPRNLGTSD